MADFYEPDVGTSFYRSKDPIKNLKIRVHLERVTSSSIIPQALAKKNEDEDDGEEETVEMQQMRQLRQLQEQFGGQKDAEEYTFRWQEKVFSQREVDLYSNIENCETVLERKYHHDISLFREEGRPTKRLFSYVDHDNYTTGNEEVTKMTYWANETPTVLAKNMATLRHRKVARAKDDGGLVPKLNIIDLDPSEDMIKKNHLLSTPVQTMYIMGDLSQNRDAETIESEEFILCTIRFDANGVLSIRPDFNKGRKAYRIEPGGLGRDVYDYTLEHASEDMSKQEQMRERKMIRQLYSRHTEYLSSLVGVEFEPMPPMETIRVLVYGEIMSAWNFENNNLYISYFLDIPPCWYLTGGSLSGITQVCSTKTEGRDQVSHFCFPINFELLYKPDSINENKKDEPPKWPILYVEVLSLDTWERYRIEGYTYLILPSVPGSSTRTVHCWRPLGRSPVSELRRFFIGGSPELEDPTYAAIPSTFEGSHLSKYGFRTISTGSVKLKFNIIHQSQAFLRMASSKKSVGNLLERLGASSSAVNIASVMHAFMRAKQRMIAARENLKKEYIETLRAKEVFEEDSD